MQTVYKIFFKDAHKKEYSKTVFLFPISASLLKIITPEAEMEDSFTTLSGFSCNPSLHVELELNDQTETRPESASILMPRLPSTLI